LRRRRPNKNRVLPRLLVFFIVFFLFCLFIYCNFFFSHYRTMRNTARACTKTFTTRVSVFNFRLSVCHDLFIRLTVRRANSASRFYYNIIRFVRIIIIPICCNYNNTCIYIHTRNAHYLRRAARMHFRPSGRRYLHIHIYIRSRVHNLSNPPLFSFAREFRPRASP